MEGGAAGDNVFKEGIVEHAAADGNEGACDILLVVMMTHFYGAGADR